MKSILQLLTLLVGSALFAQQSKGQTWCGKNYLPNQPVVPPGGKFPIPANSSEQLLAFRCAPAIRPYLGEDTEGAIIVDAILTYSKIAGAMPLAASNLDSLLLEDTAFVSSSDLQVSVAMDGQILTSGNVLMNASGHELSFSLASLTPRTRPFDVECIATSPSGQVFKSRTSLLRLPDRSDGGSVTKLDGRTGALLVKNASTGGWETVFPLGFYASFGGYLDTNLSVLNDYADRGFNIVHPIPTFDNLTALNEVMDRMEEVGLYLMYDMRHTYMNATSVTEQVNMIKSRKNLLLWYTSDEPDGHVDPLNATSSARSLINSLDGGGYHPVSLVFNCKDYYFTEYIDGADVVMQDVYPIGINATFSVVYETPCTDDFGVCGCDNCIDDFADISQRMDDFAFRLEAVGEAKTKAVWAVPQAFGAAEFWSRIPTGNEWLVESIVAINHGAKGIMPWLDPTTPDIKESATNLAHAVPTIKSFLFDPNVKFSASRQSPIDIGIWTSEGRTLVLASNTENVSKSQTVDIPVTGEIATELLNSGGTLELTGAKLTVSLEGLGSLALVIQSRYYTLRVQDSNLGVIAEP